jgi:membrane associated rhomboid family serine protease
VPILFLPYIVEIPAVFYLGVWCVGQLFSGTLALIGPEYYEGVAWWAHVGGFVAGLALLPVFKKTPQQYSRT